MNLSKKLVSVFLIVAFLLHGLGILTVDVFDMQNIYAEEQNEVLQSTEEMSEELREIFNELAEKGIFKGYKDGTFRPDETITRAEFCAVVNRMQNLQDAVAADPGITPFSDVPPEHWAAADINVAYTAGIIKGYGDGRFGPEYMGTYEQAVKMLVCALGYEALALEKGKYPEGYLLAAVHIGLVKDNSSAQIGQPAKRGLIATLTYNAINIKLPEQVIVTDNLTYTSSGGRSSGGGGGGGSSSGGGRKDKSSGEVSGRGVITGNENFSLLSGVNQAQKNQITIDGEIYNVGKLKVLSEYVGYKIYFEAEKERKDDIPTITNYRFERNNVLTIKAEDILPATTTQKIVYWESSNADKPKSAPISETARVIFNGRPLSGYAKQLDVDIFKPLAGSLKLIDNDEDYNYDVIYVTSIQYYIVERVNTYDDKVIVKYGNKDELIWDLDSKEYDIKISFNGNQISSISYIRPDDVLEVLESNNTVGTKVIQVNVVRNNVEGNVEEINSEYIRIGKSKSYSVMPGCYYEEWPEVQDRVKLFLTSDDKVIGIEVKIYTYMGFLVNVYKADDISDIVMLDMLDLDGTKRKLSVDSDFEINGQPILKYFEENGFEPQLIQYITKGQTGKIKQIILAAEGLEGNEKYDVFSKDYSGKARYVKSNAANRASRFVTEQGDEYKYEEITKVIFVPYGDKAKKMDNYKIGYKFVDGGEYLVDIYEVNEFDQIEVLVLKETENMPKQLIEDQSLAVVVSLNEVSIPKYGVVKEMRYLQDGYMKYGVYIDKDTVWDNVYGGRISVGDIIQFAVNDDGFLEDVLQLTPDDEMEYQEMDRSTLVGEQEPSGTILVYGEVYDVFTKDSKELITIKFSEQKQRTYNLSNCRNVYMFDTRENKYIAADKNAISKQKVVYMRTRDSGSEVLDVVILP